MFSGINDDCLIIKSIYRNDKFDYSMFDSPIVSFGCPSELVPSREEVLQQLGISKEQDEEMQLKYNP